MASEPLTELDVNQPAAPRPTVGGKTTATLLAVKENIQNPKKKLTASARAASALALKSNNAKDEGKTFVAASETNYKDIFCVRGSSIASHAANAMYRQLVTSNKAYFDGLKKDEQEAFASQLWEQLKDAGHRFLLPVGNKVSTT